MRGGGNGARFEGALGVVVVGSVLAIGSVHVPVALGFSALACGAGGLAFHRLAKAGRGMPWPAALLLGLSAWSLLCALPLPTSLLRALNPKGLEIWDDAYAALAQPAPEFLPLSLAPGATLHQAALYAGFASTWVLASFVARRRGGQPGAAILAGSAALVAVATLLHGAAEAETVFGVYTPRHTPARWNMGPLLNPNNLAGYCNLGTFAALGLLFAREPVVPRPLLAVAAATTLSTSLLAGSRGGVGGLLLGAVAFSLLRAASGRSRPPRGLEGRFGPAIVLLPLAGSVGLFVWASGSAGGSWYSSDTATKPSVWKDVLRLIADHPWTGVGRGAFESVFPAYRSGPNGKLFSHPENLPLQWAVEWGVPVATLALLGLALFVGPMRLGATRRAEAAGLWTGALALGAQNLVDLSLEVPGVALALAAALGTCHGARRAPSEALVGASWRWRVALGALAVTGLVAAALRATPSLDVARRELQKEYREFSEGRLESSALTQLGARQVLRFPAEPYFPRLLALVALRTPGENALPWLQQALRRGPTIGLTHYVVARALGTRGHLDQALLELRLALTYDSGLALRAARFAVSLTRDPERLARSAPQGAAGASQLLLLARELPERSLSARTALLEKAVTADPSSAAALTSLASLRLDASAAGAAPCAETLAQRCRELALEDARRAVQLAPEDLDAATALGRALVALGRTPEAEQVLETACAKATGRERDRCRRARVMALAPGLSRVRLAALAEEVAQTDCGSRSECAETESWLGSELRKRDPRAALRHLRRAAELEATPERWMTLGDAAEEVGEDALAATAFSRAAGLGGGESARTRAEAARRRAVTGQGASP